MGLVQLVDNILRCREESELARRLADLGAYLVRRAKFSEKDEEKKLLEGISQYKSGEIPEEEAAFRVRTYFRRFFFKDKERLPAEYWPLTQRNVAIGALGAFLVWHNIGNLDYNEISRGLAEVQQIIGKEDLTEMVKNLWLSFYLRIQKFDSAGFLGMALCTYAIGSETKLLLRERRCRVIPDEVVYKIADMKEWTYAMPLIKQRV